MISNKTVHSFMKQLIEKVLENEHLDCLLETEIDNLKGFKLPKKLNHKELLLKVSAMGFITIEKVNGKTVHIKLTERGKLFFENHHKNRISSSIKVMCFLINTLLAIVAIIISIIALHPRQQSDNCHDQCHCCAATVYNEQNIIDFI